MPGSSRDSQHSTRAQSNHELGVSTSNSKKPLLRGRFAPSPSGPLHFGSLVSAVCSYLVAKSAGAEWLLRIEDIDPPREIEGAADTILRQLETFALHWDGPVQYQRQKVPHFFDILEQLKANKILYACDCTRKKIQSISDDGRYPNICQDKKLDFEGEVAWKLRHGNKSYDFYDQIQGHCQFPLSLYQEDFTVKRKDGLIAYQLAVVVDDIEAGIDHVVRGSDLLDSTPRQLRLYDVLKAEPPQWYHHPVATHSDGNKLSKQNHAPSVDQSNPSTQLYAALQFLGQKPPSELLYESTQSIMNWACKNFELKTVPQQTQIIINNEQ